MIATWVLGLWLVWASEAWWAGWFQAKFVLVLLLHFSIAISRLSGETKVLAQEVARLDREVRELSGQAKPDEVTAASAEA